MSPVLTDRHGFVLLPGSTVEKIEDSSRFVVSEVMTVGTAPVVYLLKDGKGNVVDASLVMLTEEEKEGSAWERATFCGVCFNYYDGGVTWFKTTFDHPKRPSVMSACDACLCNIEPSTLPEIAWVA